ncbi:MAG: STAS domain-containing protein [Bacteroidales bacterium]|jgi:anti-anti-sigma factor|nr:STAS domain-containing protein [Bacteroidales bacterium]
MVKINRVGEVFEVTFDEMQQLNIFVSDSVKPPILKLFEEQQGAKVLINMKGVHFLDSSGFATLLSISKEAEKSNGKLVFCNISASALHLFEVLHLHLSFHIVAEREEALQWLQ